MREYIQPRTTPPREPEEKPSEPPLPRPLRRFNGWVNSFLLLGVLLYGGALLLSRTEGMAHLICEQLETRTGLKFKAGRTALTPSLGLVMNEVTASVPDHPLKAGLTAERVYLRWKWLPLFFGGDSPLKELRVENATLNFGLDEAGRWQPESFGAVSTWLARRFSIDLARYTNLATQAASSNHPPSAGSGELDLFAEDRVEMLNGAIHWKVVADSEIGRAEGLHLTSTRVPLPSRTATHFELKVRSAATAQGLRWENKTMELFDVEGRELWIDGWPTNVTTAVLPQPPVLIKRPQPLRKLPDPAPAPQISTTSLAATNTPQPVATGNPFPGPEE